jgi:hypothetical protein
LDYRGARYYDADVARFLSLDPLAVNYPTLSDYNYVAGNPVILVDPDGRDLHLSFQSQEAKASYVDLVNKSLGGNFELRLVELPNNDGIFTHAATLVISTPGAGFSKMTKKEEAFFFIYKGVVSDETVARQIVVLDDPNTDVGHFKTNALDMGDIEKFDKAGDGGASSAGALIHETVEQLSKAKKGLGPGEDPGGMGGSDYQKSHKTGIKAENAVNGNKRDEKTGTFADKKGNKTKQNIQVDPYSGEFSITKTKVQ